MSPMSYTSRGAKRRRRYAQGQPARKSPGLAGESGPSVYKGLVMAPSVQRREGSKGWACQNTLGSMQVLAWACRDGNTWGGGEWGMGRVDAQ